MKDKTNTLEQAIASVEMEGFNFTQKDKDICKALASGEISLSKFIEDCKAGKFRSYVGGEAMCDIDLLMIASCDGSAE